MWRRGTCPPAGDDMRAAQQTGGADGERGAALLLALLVLVLLAALGAGAVLTSSTDVLIAANYRDAREVLYAADAAVGRTLSDLAARADWTPVLSGAERSAFADGPPAGLRSLPDGSTIDLTAVASLADCGRAARCSPAQLDAVTPERPWGADNPRWQLFEYGPCGRLAPQAAGDRACYVVVLVGDDPSETDGDPARDGAPGSPGAGIIVVRAEAFGLRGLRQTIEATVARVTDETGVSTDRSERDASEPPPSGSEDRPGFVRLLSWRWIR